MQQIPQTAAEHEEPFTSLHLKSSPKLRGLNVGIQNITPIHMPGWSIGMELTGVMGDSK